MLHSFIYSILKGGKPVIDILGRELGRVKDGNLILAIYEEMKEFWKLSTRVFDQTIKELFENDMFKTIL